MNKRKLALITGAAGGIGGAVARRFLREGYRLILVDKNVAALRAKFGKPSSDKNVIQVVADLEDASALQPLRATVNGAGQGLAAAAFCHGGCVVDSTPFPDIHYWDLNYRNNLASCVNVIHACAKSLRKGRANVVVVSSVDAILGLEGAGPYDAAKAAQVSLAKSIARAYAPEVCAITLVLGTVCTPAWRRAVKYTPNVFRKRGNENLAGRVIFPEEVAGLVWLLCQDEARIMRGQSVVADNGWSFLAGTFRFDQRKRLATNVRGWVGKATKD